MFVLCIWATAVVVSSSKCEKNMTKNYTAKISDQFMHIACLPHTVDYVGTFMSASRGVKVQERIYIF